MTGIGEARLQTDRLTAVAEARSVNNRHFKLACRISEPYSLFEPEIERLVRSRIHRGTVQVSLRVDRPRSAGDYALNLVALESYREQLRAWQGAASNAPIDLAALLALPGVVEDRRDPSSDPRDDWPALASVVSEAIERLRAARVREGDAMARELLELATDIGTHLAAVEARRPEVVEGYHQRLRDRIQALVERHGVTLEPDTLVREVAIFAERADVAEEITRLKAHLEQFDGLIRGPESAGRRLEFVVQEMGREINTIGSKANDIAISRAVVEMKGLLERIRELIQNVE